MTLMNSKDPKFNKKILDTKHAGYLNAINLLKMGQIDEKEMEQVLREFAHHGATLKNDIQRINKIKKSNTHSNCGFGPSNKTFSPNQSNKRK